MPPKSKKVNIPEPESESESEEDMMDFGGGFDMGRFSNPHYSRDFLAALPPKLRDRVRALQGVDEKYKGEKIKCDAEIVKVIKKYEALYAPIFERRRKLVSGEAEAEEKDVSNGYPEDHKGLVSLESGEKNDTEKGLQNFWLDALFHHVMIEKLIEERDADALEFLEDVSTSQLTEPHHGFTITFQFADNEFFKNSALSKTYYLKRVDEDWAMEKATATEIEWKEGKNLTVKTISKKQKSKSKKGAVRYVTKTEPCDSFFNFFKGTKKHGSEEEEEKEEEAKKEKKGEESDDEDDEDAEDDEMEQMWFGCAQIIKEKIIPYAVEYFIGEAPDGSSDIDDDEEGEEDEEDEEDEEEDVAPPKGGRGAGGFGRGGGRGGGAAAPAGGRGGKAPQQECKQQ